jgi:hypothetical protein
MSKDVCKNSLKQYFCCTVIHSWFVFQQSVAVPCMAQVVSGTAVAVWMERGTANKQ